MDNKKLSIAKKVESLQRDIIEIKSDIKKILEMLTSIYEFENDNHPEEKTISISVDNPPEEKTISINSPETEQILFLPPEAEQISLIPPEDLLISKIYVDGCCNKDTKGCGWGSVTDENGVNLLDSYTGILSDFKTEKVETPKGNHCVLISKFTDVASQQNNGAELLGMVAGLRVAIKCGCKVIYSDSSLIVDYWSQNRITSKTKNKMDPDKYRYIQECVQLRKHFESGGGKIVKISGDDNKADLGYHNR